MIRHTLALALAALALAPNVRAQSNDQYLFTIDTVHTNVVYSIETDVLGLCVPVLNDACPMTGSLDVELHAGLLPIDDAAVKDGDVLCLPHLLAIVPNVLPSLPPLLEVDVEGLRLAPNSTTFPVLANGTFNICESYDVLDGLLKVKSLGLQPVTVPLVGLTSDAMRTHGRVQIDANGIRLSREIGNSLIVDVPILGIQVRIALRGIVEAQFHYPPPSQTCATTPNSVGAGATLDLSGTVSVSRNDLWLSCHGCPPGARSVAILGNVQAQAVFGQGQMCIGGNRLRLGSLNIGVDGTGSVSVPLGACGVQVGTTALLQVLYSDGAVVDLTNTLQILACP